MKDIGINTLLRSWVKGIRNTAKLIREGVPHMDESCDTLATIIEDYVNKTDTCKNHLCACGILECEKHREEREKINQSNKPSDMSQKDWDCEQELASELAEDELRYRETKSLVYVATPYSDPDPAVKQERFNVVNKVSAFLMGKGLHIFSPISHTHPIALKGALPGNWEFWEAYDRIMLEHCCKVIVVKQDGWKESTGVAAEIAIAKEMNIPVEYIDPC